MFIVWSQCCVPSNISEASLMESGEGHPNGPCSGAVALEENAGSVYPVCSALALKLGQYRFTLGSHSWLVFCIWRLSLTLDPSLASQLMALLLLLSGNWSHWPEPQCLMQTDAAFL